MAWAYIWGPAGPRVVDAKHSLLAKQGLHYHILVGCSLWIAKYLRGNNCTYVLNTESAEFSYTTLTAMWQAELEFHTI